jgi:hypothetical protein
MKNIRWFETLKEYREFIGSHIAVTPIFHEHPYYRGLIDFIIDHRTPIFYEASEPCEYSHFTQYFNFTLMRGGYPNRFVEDMFFMHDFVHMVFNNPINLTEYSFNYFEELANHNEYVASNDTEVLTYYRLPGFRDKSLPYKILYDLIKDVHVSKPTPEELLIMRKNIVWENSSENIPESTEKDRIFAFLRKFKENNKVWCRAWYDAFPKMNVKYQDEPMILPILEYEAYLERYIPINSEEKWRNNIVRNIRNGLELLGKNELPNTFDEAREAIKRLDGEVILRDVAVTFYDQYVKVKDIK